MALFSRANLKKTWYYLKKNGWRDAVLAAWERLTSPDRFYAYQPPGQEELERQRQACSLPGGTPVKISLVVPAFHTRREHLEALLDSLEAQTYPRWELVLADAGGAAPLLEEWAKKRGKRVKEASSGDVWEDRALRLCRLPKNGGISENTNAGIGLALGELVGLADHDDLLTPDALWEMAMAWDRAEKSANAFLVLYSDEDKCDGEARRFYEPHRKTDFDAELLLTNNYICHFLVMDRGLLQRLMLRPEFDGAQDYDLVLRACRAGAVFVHVPRVLYHWRCHEDSTASNPQSKSYAYEAGRRAVEDFCRQSGWEAKISGLKHLGFYRADYAGGIFARRPEVGVVGGPLKSPVFGGRFVSGIYEPDGSQRYPGLFGGFSGPMHRAALQQSVWAADLRNMRVCPALREEFEAARARCGLPSAGSAPESPGSFSAGTPGSFLGSAPAGRAREEQIRRESIAFCRGAAQRGCRILWDPAQKPAGGRGKRAGM
ncbi:MAG: glycosyltransferase [Eubacteriales bacterium]|nr:glycosyltransferase [Eubacteriales bacterium]